MFIHNNLVHKELTGNLLYTCIMKYCKSTVLLCGDKEFLFQTFVIFPPFSQNLITWPNYINVITSFCCVDLIEESILYDLGHQPMDGFYGVFAAETTEQNVIHYSRIKDWISYLIHNWFCTLDTITFLMVTIQLNNNHIKNSDSNQRCGEKLVPHYWCLKISANLLCYLVRIMLIFSQINAMTHVIQHKIATAEYIPGHLQ